MLRSRLSVLTHTFHSDALQQDYRAGTERGINFSEYTHIIMKVSIAYAPMKASTNRSVEMPSIDLDRRMLLGATVSAATMAPLLRAGNADASTVTAPLRALHRFQLGSMRITIIDDARFTFPAAAFATNQPKVVVGKFLESFGLPNDVVSLHMQTTLVESGPHKLLLDTGMGDVTFPGNAPDNGRLASGLRAIGVTQEQITAVAISHGHPDHIGGCSLNGEPCFKNATYFMPPNEFEFWTQKPGPEKNFPNFMLTVGNEKLGPIANMIKPYGEGDQIIPGVTAVAAHGHTLGHHAFLLESGASSLLHLMDAAVHYLVGLEEPDWSLGVEMDAARAADTRKALFRQAAAGNLLVAGYHFPFPGVGRIVEQGAAWRFVPVQTS